MAWPYYRRFGWTGVAVAVYCATCSMDRHLPPIRVTAEARWQSGYAADCNSVYAGSIPTLASIYISACALIVRGRFCWR